MNVLDLFSGIGGFSLGLERAGMRTVAFCEIDPYCRAVLKKHWPNVPCYDDVRTLTAERLAADGIAADVICGGFPCQDISTAGKWQGSRAQEAVCGETIPELLATLDRVLSSWKTSQHSLLGGLTEFSATWPRSGLMRSGTASRLPPLAPLTAGTASGLWPTPQTQYDGRTQEAWEKAKAQKAAKHRAGHYSKGSGPPGMMDLQRAVRLWPTPTVYGNYNRKGLSAPSGDGLATAAGGTLNPAWVEWLMGFPPEWTALDASETPSSRKSRKSSDAQS